ncbi:hypothetical protein FOLKNPGA_02627 [Legionella sp. PC1000]|nr:hypothetical protein FOLKNPGA_02627 [Legionella sp. PC1000]
MFDYLSGLVKAGYYTLKSVNQGQTSSYAEMQEAQRDRMNAFTALMTHMSYTPAQIKARKQYWYTQILFLINLLEIQPEFLKSSELKEKIGTLIQQLDKDEVLKGFLHNLEQHATSKQKTIIAPANQQNKDDVVIQGDVIQQVRSKSDGGYYVIVNDAANSHRDGAAKYSQGSLEELFSRFTDQALKLALHFDDVHKLNQENGFCSFQDDRPTINVLDYQKRYLKMVLTIMSKLVQNEAYLESPEFFNDLFNSFPGPNGLPIYFDMQDNAYQVPVDDVSFSTRLFQDTSKLASISEVIVQAQTSSPNPIGVTSYAAPDLRIIETSPLDTRCTSNSILANPTREGTLGYMIHHGVSNQCEQAIKIAKENAEKSKQPVHVLFVLPGCGAFKNPETIAAAYFVSTIKFYEKQFAEHGISFNIVEYNPALAKLLIKTHESVGDELCALNQEIYKIKDPSLRDRAIAVRERILDLYNNGRDYKDLKEIIEATTNLLKCDDEKKIDATVDDFQNKANKFHQENELFRALINFISQFIDIKYLNKDLALNKSASELLACSTQKMFKAGLHTTQAASEKESLPDKKLTEKSDSREKLIIKLSEDFLKNWESLNKAIVRLDEHTFATIDAIVNGIKFQVEREAPLSSETAKAIGHSLFNMLEYLRVDINKPEGIRGQESELADCVETLILDYVTKVSAEGDIKILNRMGEVQKIPEPILSEQLPTDQLKFQYTSIGIYPT